MTTLESSRLQYRQMFSENRAVMLLIDPDNGQLKDASQGACEYYGYSLPELMSMTIFGINIMGKADIEEEMQRAKEGSINYFHFQHRLASGEVREVEVYSNPISLEGHDFLYSVIHDITERKLTEEKLRKSEEKFRGIFDESVAAIYVFDREKNFIDSNRAGLDLLGYSRDELLSIAIADVDADPNAVIPAHNLLLGGGRISNYEHQLIRKDGKVITVLNNSRPLTETDGSIIGMQSTLIDISDRNQAEEDLRESEFKYRSLMEYSPLSIQEISPDGKTLSVNKAWEKLWGVPFSALENYNVFEDCELVERGILQYIEKALAGEIVEISAHEYNKENVPQVPGQTGVLWVRTFIYPLHGNDGKLHEIVLIQEDVSESKRVASKIHESENLYRSLIETTNTGYLILNSEGKVIDANQEYVRLTGHQSLEEILNRSVVEWTAKYDLERNAREVAKCMEHGFVHDLQVDYAHPDGNILSIEINAKVITKEGEMQIMSLCRDITERKQQEQEFNRFINLSPDIIGTGNLQGYFTTVNVGFEKMLGYAKEELFNQPFISFVHDDDVERTLEALSEAARGKYNLRIENRYRCKDGSYKWIDWLVLSLVQERKFYAIGRDVSDRKAVERAQFEKEKAEAAAQAKSQFLANMSHEIRTPLNGVLGLARMGEGGLSPEKTQQTFARISESGEHLLHVVNDILDFSKIEAGMLAVENHPFKLIVAVENAIKLVKAQAEVKELLLGVDVTQELPVWVNGDKLRLEQILINLLSNAIKFTERGEVRIRVECNDDDMVFLVTDSGIGMNEAQRARLFTPFEQADASMTRRFGGTGLGLAISGNLAQLMGGKIKVESKVGEGSDFTLLLPLREVTAPIQSETESTEIQGTQLEGIHILAAEDVEINRMILEDMLENEGAHVIFADNGQQALEHLEKLGWTAFDVVLMDVQMPVMDGYEATRHILEMAPTLPVIGLTAHALVEEREKCLATGMVEHVTKPIDPDTLIAAIRRHIELI